MKIKENLDLKFLTTFRTGGKARFFCPVKNERELIQALNFAEENNLPFFILGGGSNILVSDSGFSGLAIKMENKGVEFEENREGGVIVNAMAGEDWDSLVLKCVEKSLWGIENLSMIPGTVGAAPVQNIGAYGSEIKDVIDSVRTYDLNKKEFIEFNNKECLFEYRSSIFKKEFPRYIIVSVKIKLKIFGKPNLNYKDLKDYFSKEKEEPSLYSVRKAVIDIRKNKLPDIKEVGTAGSFFKNPIIDISKAKELKDRYKELPIYPEGDNMSKVSLAWIIDNICGYKNIKKGNVGTYKNQALVIVNEGNATSEEIKSFAREIGNKVKEKTGLDIEPEVRYVG